MFWVRNLPYIVFPHSNQIQLQCANIFILLWKCMRFSIVFKQTVIVQFYIGTNMFDLRFKNVSFVFLMLNDKTADLWLINILLGFIYAFSLWGVLFSWTYYNNLRSNNNKNLHLNNSFPLGSPVLWSISHFHSLPILPMRCLGICF